jgi:hypothetical protein
MSTATYSPTTRTKGEITPEVLEQLGFERYHPKKSDWHYNAEQGFYSAEHGSFKFLHLNVFIRTISDLKQIRDWIDQPSDKTRYSTKQERYY